MYSKQQCSVRNTEKTRYDRITLHVYVYNFFTGTDPEFEELWDGFLYKLRICRAIGLKKSF